MVSKKTVRRAREALTSGGPAVADVFGARTSVDPATGAVRAEGGVGSEFINPFTEFGLGSLDAASARQGITPTEAGFDIRQLFAGAGAPTGVGQDFLQTGADIASAFRNFDPDAFATTQLERLNRIAGPAEATEANRLANRLFTSGRLGAGDTSAGAAFGELGRRQASARDERAIRALGLAGQEADRLRGAALDFARGGTDITGAGTRNVADIFSTLRGEDQFQQDFTDTLLRRAAGAQEGAIAGLEGQRQALSAAFTGAELAEARRTNIANAELQRTKKKGFLDKVAGAAVGGLTSFATGGGSSLAKRLFS